jgi:hypothetical protein
MVLHGDHWTFVVLQDPEAHLDTVRRAVLSQGWSNGRETMAIGVAITAIYSGHWRWARTLLSNVAHDNDGELASIDVERFWRELCGELQKSSLWFDLAECFGDLEFVVNDG